MVIRDMVNVAEWLDFRGVRLDRSLMLELVRCARDEHGDCTLRGARFDNAVFVGAVDFERVRFEERQSFNNARFTNDAHFGGASFRAAVDFRGACFEGEASFDSTVFGKEVDFADASFGLADRTAVRKSQTATFHNAVFTGTVRMSNVRFIGDTTFSRAVFEDTAQISCWLTGVLALHDARFRGLVELDVRNAGATVVNVDDVLFEGQITARLAASNISVHRSRLAVGGQLIVECETLTIDESRFARPTSIVAGSAGRSPQAPKLVSISGSDLSGTTIAGLNLSEARFSGVHGLDGLRIDGQLTSGGTGAGFARPRRRIVIADEADAELWSSETTFDEVAAIYRDLRASREGRKDEPGSADFYYGEMEMRRRAASAITVERAILETYRMVSGYGLRASRSVAAFVAVVLAATVSFHELLVDHPPRWLETLLFSLRATVSFVREPMQLHGMTLGGEFVQLGLRLIGPILLTLTVLAVRSRVRR